MKRFFLVVLWVITAMLALFSLISWAGEVVRIPALITVVVTIIVTAMKNSKRFVQLWTATCVLGYAMLAVSLGIIIHSLATGYVGTSSTESGFIASRENYLVSKVAVAYGEKHPTVKVVDPRYTNDTTKQVDMFIITLYGHFKRGTLQAVELKYNISADGKKIWDIRGYSTRKPVVIEPIWTDTKLP